MTQGLQLIFFFDFATSRSKLDFSSSLPPIKIDYC